MTGPGIYEVFFIENGPCATAESDLFGTHAHAETAQLAQATAEWPQYRRPHNGKEEEWRRRQSPTSGFVVLTPRNEEDDIMIGGERARE